MMFKQLKSQLGQQSTQDEINPDFEDMYMNSFDDEAEEDRDPEEVLNDPSASYDSKTRAIEMIKDRYLKPRE